MTKSRNTVSANALKGETISDTIVRLIATGATRGRLM
jgi:hypothetical protein